MSWVIRNLGLAGQVYNPGGPDNTGLFLQAFDPEFRGGRGAAVWTEDPDLAMHFATAEVAWELWRTQSVTMPIRADGQPNRPLTAYTVEVIREELL